MMTRYLQEVEGVKRSAERDGWTYLRLEPFFAGHVLAKLKRSDVREYIARRKAQGVKNATINRETGLLSAAINHARTQWDWDISNPAQSMRLREDQPRERYLTPEEAVRLLATAKKQHRAPHMADLLTVAMFTGCRRGELLGLEWSRVDLKANVLRLGGKDTKSGKARLVPLVDEAREALLSRFRYRASTCPDSPWVFCTKAGKRIAGIKTGFSRACLGAAIEGMRFHDLRHTAASWMVQRGVPIEYVAYVLGHSSKRMTERYAHFAPENAWAAVEKLRGVLSVGHKVVHTDDATGEALTVTA